jgi:hypothetical protein
VLFQNPGNIKKFIAAFLGLLVLAVCVSTCHGAELELGYGKTLVRGPTDAIIATIIWPRQIGKIDLYAGALLVGSYEYGNHSFDNQIIARAGFTAHIGNVAFDLGLAKISHADALNSGDLNFNVGIHIKVGGHVQIYLDSHFSNAGTHAPNTGRDIAAIAWRFR